MPSKTVPELDTPAPPSDVDTELDDVAVGRDQSALRFPELTGPACGLPEDTQDFDSPFKKATW